MTLLWPPASLPQTLEIGCVHVWAWNFVCSAEQLQQLTAVLSHEERERMNRFRFERDQVRYAVCHGNLRHLLGSYVQLQPSLLQFEENEYGRPRLSESAPQYANLNFNLSHTSDVALLGIARGMTIGVDVEHIRPIEADIAERFFSPHELLELEELEGPGWLEGFYNCWTRKEAILKAEGVGLNVRLDAFDVSLTPGAHPQLVAHRTDACLKTDWRLSTLKPSHATVGAIATSRTPVELRCRQLSH